MENGWAVDYVAVIDEEEDEEVETDLETDLETD